MNHRPMLSRALTTVVLLFGGAMVGADCEGNIVQDPAFRDWCGASLCSWQTDRGQIQRVPTWDANDLGVSFLDVAGGTQISQVTDEHEATCILFSSVGDIAPSAQMTVSADFDSDGTIDFTGPLGTATWHRVQTEITAPSSYQGITFYVTKNGTGTAVLAEMQVQSSTGCAASSAPPLANLRFGDPCASSSECASGVCPDATDGGLRLCSQCSDEAPCPSGQACAQVSVFFPFQCAPGQRLGITGAPCISDTDCASGSCVGATPVGLASGDAAPCDLNTIDASGDPANCSWDGARGGTCQ